MSSASSWNRRDFLRFAGLAVTAAARSASPAAAARTTAAVGVPTPSATPQRDRAILNGALTLENTAVAAYTAGLPLLRGDVAPLRGALPGPGARARQPR